tara:strand:+ start:105 stop:506 length:402 start_codon:yes stop_codon:yes gene_type:complete
MQAGWTAFPSILLEKQSALGLDSLDINILLYLSTYWWTDENKPHPSKRTIAQAIGVDAKTIQRRIASLEGAGFLKREYRPDLVKGNKSNKYHMDGLVSALKPFAVEKLEGIEVRKSEEHARLVRKKPQLKSVK